MKALLKGMLFVMMLTFAISVSAEPEITNENISFDYGSNSFTVTQPLTGDESKELTVMLIKGEHVTGDLSSVSAADVYYVGQATGNNYAEVFEDIGVKYTNGKFEPGVYTLITSGADMTATRTKLVIGNAVDADNEFGSYVHTDFAGANVTFGTITQSLRVDEDPTDEYYIYVAVGSFSAVQNLDDIGFLVQRMNDSGIERAYKSFSNLNVLKNIASIDGTVEIGLQLNKVPNEYDIVAIPYIGTITQEG